MAWAKAGTTTLGSAGDDLDITSMTANKFNQFLVHTLNTGGTSKHNFTFDNNDNTDYARRRSYNGAADSTDTSQVQIEYLGDEASDRFEVIYGSNITSEEKLNIHFAITGSTVPNRAEAVSKADITTNSGQYTRIDCNNTGGSGDFDTGSNISALGSELTPASATSIETGSIYIDTDTASRYWFDGSNWRGNPITYDNQAIIQNGSVGTSAPTTFSNFTVGNNPNRILVVACGSYNSNPDITGITWNGSESFTHITRKTRGTNYKVELWYLVNPTPTTANVVISSSGMGQMGAIVYSFYNVDQSAPIGAIVTKDESSASTTPFINITPTNTGSMIVDCWYNGANSATPNNDLTDGVNIICGGVDRSMASQYSLTPTIGSVNSMSRTSGIGNYVQIACEIKNG